MIRNAHGRQDHDINRRVRINPEEMLIKYGVASQRRIQEPDMKYPFANDHQQGNANYRGSSLPWIQASGNISQGNKWPF